MNRFNYGAQATQAVSLVGGLITAGSHLKKTAQNTERTAKGIEKAAQNTEQIGKSYPIPTSAKSDFMNDPSWENKAAEGLKKRGYQSLDEYYKAKNRPQQNVNEVKAKSSDPTLDINEGLLDLVNNQAAETTTDNTEVE